MRVPGKTILITGAGSGIGAAAAELLAVEGATVILVGRTESKLQAVKKVIESKGGAAACFATDLQHADNVQRLFDTVLQTHPRLDGVINSAAVGTSWEKDSPGSMNDIATTPIDKYHEIVRLNLDSTVFVCRLAVQQMQTQRYGSIINFSSVYGAVGAPTHHTYALTKAAITHLTRSMAVAYARDGIRVNCIIPGFIDTPMNDGAAETLFANRELAATLMPITRPGSAMEVAYACLYLVSDESSYTTGVALPVDGGWCAT
ncbi:MAG: SDR family oxidoreductase [Steroidobacteraceae bacterium]